MKKLIIGVLVALCAVCLSVAVACNKKDGEPKYFTLTFEKTDGVTYDCEIPNGYEVREGETVTFGVTCASNVVGDPVVSANDSRLTADESGRYAFKMNSDTTVSVSGTFILNRYQVTFDKGDPDGDDYRLTYHSDDGDVDEGFYVSAGERVSFTVDMSVYYDTSKMNVLANTTVLKPDSNGVYSFTVNGKTNITITDVTLAQWFGEKQDAGDGTKENPFIISEPIDLYELAAIIKAPLNFRRFYSAYYRMEKDIDLKGEQLYIIGDSDTYPFAGHFDGNGHTISNFYINDVIIDQETYVPYHTPYVGMFGYVSATPQDDGLAEIYNLKLDNFTVEVNAAEGGNSFFAGSVVGWGYGVGITGCEVANGTIIADADTGYFGYIGGIIGYQNSVYQSESVIYNSIVNACSSSVDVIGASGYVFAAGGISGVVSSSNTSATSAVINSYSTGDVSGAMYTGGVVGRLSTFSSVQGSYSTGFVEARNSISLTTGLEEYAYAYAGGIVGYVDNDGIIADCFSVSETNSVAAANASGKQFAYSDPIACGYGLAKDGNGHISATIEANPAVVLNSYSDNIDEQLIKNQLGWHAEDWTFVDGNEYPVINKSADGEKQFTLKINLGSEKLGGKGEISYDIDSVYTPVGYWYALVDGIDYYGFVNADSGNRSYGLYFDGEFKNKVPYGYIPINDVTLYAGFADYGAVAGDYYFPNIDGGYISLSSDGVLKYCDGALSHTSYYSYDGETLTLYDTFIGIAFDGTDTYQSFKATLSDVTLTVYDNEAHLLGGDEIHAIKTSSNFNYGSYYTADGTVCTFNKNGTGSAVTSASTVNFTYEITGGGLNVVAGTQSFTCQVDANGNVTSYNGVAVTPMDKFAGVWEKSAGSKVQYSFNGKGYGGNGEFTMTSFGYDKDGNKVNVTTQSGTYTVNSDGEIVLNGDKIGINQDGGIVVNGVAYYKENSFAGVWNFFNSDDPVEITLNGIGVDGVGTALVDYGAYGSYEASYAAVNGLNGTVIMLYHNDIPLAQLSYNAGENTLAGRTYLARRGNIIDNATFFLYDDFKGTWISDVLELVEFNGLGNYDVAGNVNHLAVSGGVTVNGAAVEGGYTLVDSTLTGSFVYEGTTYNLSYANGKIEVTYDGGSFDFIKYDGMYGLELKDTDGLVYGFDGRGNLPSGGTLTVSNGNTYNYKNVVGGMDIYAADGVTNAGTIAVGTDFVLNLGAGDKTLTLVNGFTGEWLIAGEDGTLVVGEINAAMKAQGSVRGESVEFTYHTDGSFLSFTDEGVVFRIDVAEADSVTELIVSLQNEVVVGVCVSPASLDGYQGTYTAAGTGNYLTLDGVGYGKHVSGLAEVYADGELSTSYAYTINSYGIELAKGSLRYLFIECSSEDEGAYGNGGVYRKIVACDALYKVTASLATLNVEGKLEVDDSVKYTFNGIGTLTCSDGTVYTYTIDLRDRTNMKYNLSLENSAHAKSKAVVYYGGEKVTVEFGACDITPEGKFKDKDDIEYSFDGLSNLSVGGTFFVTSGDTTTLLIYKVESGKIKIYNSNGTDYGEFVTEGGYKIVLANGKGEISLTAAD